MKRFFHPLALAALMLGVLAMGSLTSCKKDLNAELNPPTDDGLIAAPFSLTAEEHRGTTGATFDWVITNGSTDSVPAELDAMTVTAHNSFTITVEPKGNPGAFPGVNVRSSNVNAVQVEMLGKSSFKLKYIGDGEARIRVWNGTESGNTSMEFPVKSVKKVAVEGLRFRVNGEERVTKMVTTGNPDRQSFTAGIFKLNYCGGPCFLWKDKEYPFEERSYGCSHYGVDVEFLGIEPENASWGKVLAFKSDIPAIRSRYGYNDYYSYLAQRGRERADYPLIDNLFERKKDVWKDVGELEGLRYFMTNGAENGDPCCLVQLLIETDNGILYVSAPRNPKFDEKEKRDLDFRCPLCDHYRDIDGVVIF